MKGFPKRKVNGDLSHRGDHMQTEDPGTQKPLETKKNDTDPQMDGAGKAHTLVLGLWHLRVGKNSICEKCLVQG